jgi:hypothetical protein
VLPLVVGSVLLAVAAVARGEAIALGSGTERQLERCEHCVSTLYRQTMRRRYLARLAGQVALALLGGSSV